MFENLEVARDGAVAVITIRRPQVLNALNIATLDELRQCVVELTADRGVRCAVVTGAGDKAFVAGADINELAVQSAVDAKTYAERGQHVLDLIENMGKPVIAAINGFALGGGCELALACTLRIAAEHARLGQPEVNLGLIPGFGGTQRLVRLVGRGTALELLLTGAPLSAADAYRVGLVNRVVASADLRAETMKLAVDLAARPPIAVRYIIEAVNRGSGVPLDTAQSIEATLFGLVASTADMREGTAAFLEKRQPVFRGE
jgi:enoyl-CoA hydratase